MGNLHLQRVIVVGLTVIMLLFVVLALASIWRLQALEGRLESVVHMNADNTALVIRMRQIARERAIVLHKMVATSDPFERDELYLELLDLGDRFLKARVKLLGKGIGDQEQQLLAEQRRLSQIAVPYQRAIVDLLRSDRIEQAREMLVQHVLPSQDRVLSVMDRFVDLQTKHNTSEIAAARTDYRAAIREVAIMAGGALLLAITVGWWVTRRVGEVLANLRRTARRLRENAKRERAIRDNMVDALITADARGIIVHGNPAAAKMLGYEANELNGMQLNALMPEPYRSAHDGYIRRFVETGQARVIGTPGLELQVRRKDGSLLDVELSVAQVEREGEVLFVGILHDISVRKQMHQVLQQAKTRLEAEVAARTAELEQANRELAAEVEERKRAERHLEVLATHDLLTGLANRFHFEEQLNKLLARAKRHGESFALLYLDLDGFKPINDTMGHHCGDRLLKQVAERLRTCLREEDVLARIGGDEFAVLLASVRDEETVRHVANKILAAFAPPFALRSKQAQVGVSIGVSLYPQDANDAGVLLKRADAAMYQAKEHGKHRYQFFSDLPVDDQIDSKLA